MPVPGSIMGTFCLGVFGGGGLLAASLGSALHLTMTGAAGGGGWELAAGLPLLRNARPLIEGNAAAAVVVVAGVEVGAEAPGISETI